MSAAEKGQCSQWVQKNDGLRWNEMWLKDDCKKTKLKNKFLILFQKLIKLYFIVM